MIYLTWGSVMDTRDVSQTDAPSRCQGKLEVPTEKEREALAAMKSIKEEVRALKKRLTALKASWRDETAGEILKLEKELAHLKVKWDKWEQKRQKAAKERMILLGHEKD
jgi:chromosome segregation ATPase